MRCTPCSFVLVLAYPVSTLAWDGSAVGEPNLNPDAVLLFEGFESDGFGEQWPTFWDPPPGPETVSDPVFQGQRALLIDSSGGEHESRGGGEYAPSGGGLDAAYMRLYLRLPDDFSMG